MPGAAGRSFIGAPPREPRSFGVCARGYCDAMTSLWLADRAEGASPPKPLDEDKRSADVVVVGAGLTGLITAVLLARAGKDVLVLEALSVGGQVHGRGVRRRRVILRGDGSGGQCR
ncbi:FAD-dependent oxidoreductase, partial [Mycolicibacterium poriferae]